MEQNASSLLDLLTSAVQRMGAPAAPDTGTQAPIVAPPAALPPPKPGQEMNGYIRATHAPPIRATHVTVNERGEPVGSPQTTMVGTHPISKEEFGSAPPRPGEVMNGYRFTGGDPRDQKSWGAPSPPAPSPIPIDLLSMLRQLLLGAPAAPSAGAPPMPRSQF
jgi:hypothetical protein